MRLFGEPVHGGASMTFHRMYVCLTGAPARRGLERHIAGRWVERPLVGRGVREAVWAPNFRE